MWLPEPLYIPTVRARRAAALTDAVECRERVRSCMFTAWFGKLLTVDSVEVLHIWHVAKLVCAHSVTPIATKPKSGTAMKRFSKETGKRRHDTNTMSASADFLYTLYTKSRNIIKCVYSFFGTG